jgi:ribosomal protein L29
MKINKYIFEINCPDFSEYDEKIKVLTIVIESREISAKKVDEAQELLKITDLLLFCPKYNEEKEECENCHFVLNLRREIARIIINANRVSDESAYRC